MIFSSFGKALAQVFDPKFLSVLLKGVGLTLALFFALFGATLWLVNWLIPDSFTLFGWEIGILDNIASWGSVGLMLILSVFLMVPVASAFTGLFLDEIADAVEAKHYPDLRPGARVSFGDALTDSLQFLGVLIGVNLLALILYFFAGPFAPLLFWSVNGYLLGREYYQLVAMRRLGRAGAKASRKRHFVTIWIAGTCMAAPLSIPLVNLVIPILGAATFTHIFHALERDR